jgi:hypothetical protein
MPLVVRRLLAVGLSVAVPMGALCAPLVHAHLDDHHGGHHDANRVHAHLAGHPPAPEAPAGPRRSASAEAGVDHHVVSAGHELAVEPDADPEDVTRVQVFLAVHAAAPTSPALPQARYSLPAPLESVMRRPPVAGHSHDPPAASSTGPRAPPAFPS